MNRFFATLGVDYIQWRALMRAYIWLDYAALFGAYGPHEAQQAVRQLVVMWSFLSGTGLMTALIVWAARDLFLAATGVVTIAMLWAALLVAAQPASLAAPEDLAIVGFRPVSSRTYFAVRFSALLAMVLETTAIFGLLPVVAFMTRRDGTVLLGLAAAAAMLGVSLAITAGAVALYGWLIRIMSPAKLTRALGYAGGAIGLLGTAAMLFAVHRMAESTTPFAFLDHPLPRDLRTMWFPGAWFASYVPIAAGRAGRPEYTAALASVGLVLVLSTFLRGRMSFDYATRLADVATSTEAVRSATTTRAWAWLRGENRAIALIIAAHLRGDMTFQLSLASSVLLGVMIAAGSTGFRMPGDPFVDVRHGRDTATPLLALVMIPMQLYQNLAITQIEGTWWLYFATPANRTRLVRATREVLAAFVLLPLLLAFGVFFAIAYGDVLHAALHTVFLGAVSYISLQLTILLNPLLPFSRVLVSKRGNPFSIGAMLVVMAISMPVAMLLQFFAYPTVVGRIVGLVVLAALIWLLDVLTGRRVERRAKTFSF